MSGVKRVCSALIPVWVGLGLVLLWLVAALLIGEELILPTPMQTIEECFALFGQASFWAALGKTLLRGVLAFVCSFFIALLFSLLSMIPSVGKVAGIVFSVLRSIPTMSVILLLLIWLRPSLAPAAVAAIVILPTLYSVFLGAMQGVDRGLIELCDVYKVPWKERVLRVWLPAMAQPLFEGTASGFSLNLKLIIAAEALAQTKESLGAMMKNAQIWLETGQLMAITLVAVVVGVLSETLIRFVGKQVKKWP